MSEEAIHPDTAPKQFVFVLMPFEQRFDDVYQVGIKIACRDAGAYCTRVDEQIFHESILEQVYNQIAKADLIVADMTDRNANVFYEVGYAHALNKKTILLTKDADDIPFDLKHYPHIVYGNSIAKLKDEIERRVRWYLEQPASTTHDPFSQLSYYINGHEVLDEAEIVIPVLSMTDYTKEGKVVYQLRSEFDLGIHNASSAHLQSLDFQIGFVTDNKVLIGIYPRHPEMVTLPDGQIMSWNDGPFSMLPYSWARYECRATFYVDVMERKSRARFPVVFQVLSPLGRIVREITLLADL